MGGPLDAEGTVDTSHNTAVSASRPPKGTALPVVLYDSLVIYVMRSSIDSSWRDEASDLAAVVAQSSPAPQLGW